MKDYLSKLQENNLTIEAICFVVIALAMLVLLIRVVGPNFGNKSVALGFMTASGALVVLWYAVFMEWKAETSTQQINSYSILQRELPIRASIPAKKGITTEIANLADGTGQQIKFHRDDHAGTLITKELALVNVAMLMTGDYLDWRKSTLSIGNAVNTGYRLPSNKDKTETLLDFEDLIRSINPRHITINVNPERLISTKAIYPANTAVSASTDGITLDHKLFRVEFLVIKPTRCYKCQDKPNVIHAVPVAILVNTILKPKIHGHVREQEIRTFVTGLVQHVHRNMNVENDDMPKSTG